jgi:hypothetical protein
MATAASSFQIRSHTGIVVPGECEVEPAGEKGLGPEVSLPRPTPADRPTTRASLETWTFGELLIDLEEAKAARAVVFGLLREMERK